VDHDANVVHSYRHWAPESHWRWTGEIRWILFWAHLVSTLNSNQPTCWSYDNHDCLLRKTSCVMLCCSRRPSVSVYTSMLRWSVRRWWSRHPRVVNPSPETTSPAKFSTLLMVCTKQQSVVSMSDELRCRQLLKYVSAVTELHTCLTKQL